jgi:hypothetical protein
VNCPSSVPRDTPLEDNKAWLENSMKLVKAWYKNCLESGYHGTCASTSTKTVNLPARVIDVGPQQTSFGVPFRHNLDSNGSVISNSTTSEDILVPKPDAQMCTALHGSGVSKTSGVPVVGRLKRDRVWKEHRGVSSTYIHPLVADVPKLSLRYSQLQDSTRFPRIVETDGRQGHYVTLSYCWGSTQKGKLMTANLKAYQQYLPIDKLSRTIRDAISVVRALGFRYLWVDALCIVQDSTPDKNSQLPLMGSIYQGSQITLAAANGDHADAGLFAVRNPHAWRPCPIYQEVLANGRSCQIYAQLPRDDLYDTPLDTRAWVFQEEILARRTLKFTPKGLRWSCASFCMSEATPGIGLHPRARPHHNLREWLSQPDWKPNWAEALDPRRRYFEDWYEAVANFTQRGIKFPSDRLPAMAGLAARVKNLKGLTYLQGLWMEDLEFGLLWFVSKPRARDHLNELMRGSEYYRFVPASGSTSATHRIPRAGNRSQEWPDTSADFLGQALELKARSDYPRDLLVVRVALGDEVLEGLPSWTWACLDGPIEFLYTIRSLNASGKPMAQCLEFSAPRNEDPYLGDPSGYVVLKGALQTVIVRPCKIEDAAPSVGNGCWTAQLLRESWKFGQLTGTIIGFAALDEDPRESNIAGKSLRALLMRDDSVAPHTEERVTPSGYLRPASVLPLSFTVDERGFIKGMGADGAKKRGEWLTCLLLQETKTWAKNVYRRVGLCQMYRGVWEEELADKGKREETVALI